MDFLLLEIRLNISVRIKNSLLGKEWAQLTNKTTNLSKTRKQIRPHRVGHRDVEDGLVPLHGSRSKRVKKQIQQPRHSDFSLMIFQTSGPALLQSVTLRDADYSADFQVFEDPGVHALCLVAHIQQSCYDLHWISLQVFQLLRKEIY